MPPPCIPRVSSSIVQISVITAELNTWVIARTFQVRLSLVFTLANKKECPDCFAVLRTVSIPRHLLAPLPFLRAYKSP